MKQNKDTMKCPLMRALHFFVLFSPPKKHKQTKKKRNYSKSNKRENKDKQGLVKDTLVLRDHASWAHLVSCK